MAASAPNMGPGDPGGSSRHSQIERFKLLRCLLMYTIAPFCYFTAFRKYLFKHNNNNNNNQNECK